MNEQNNRVLDDVKQIEDEIKRVLYFSRGLSAVKGIQKSQKK